MLSGKGFFFFVYCAPKILLKIIFTLFKCYLMCNANVNTGEREKIEKKVIEKKFLKVMKKSWVLYLILNLIIVMANIMCQFHWVRRYIFLVKYSICFCESIWMSLIFESVDWLRKIVRLFPPIEGLKRKK